MILTIANLYNLHSTRWTNSHWECMICHYLVTAGIGYYQCHSMRCSITIYAGSLPYYTNHIGNRLCIISFVVITDCCSIYASQHTLLQYWHCAIDGLQDSIRHLLRCYDWSNQEGEYRIQCSVYMYCIIPCQCRCICRINQVLLLRNRTYIF